MRSAQQHFYAGRRGQVVNIPASYMVSPGFKTPAAICFKGLRKPLETPLATRARADISAGTSKIRNVVHEVQTQGIV